MATTNKKQEPVFIGSDNGERIELTGAELEEFEANRKAIREELELSKTQQEALKELKISAYKKLGLTDEEIAAII